MRVLELKGYNSYLAFCAYHKILLGLKMLPAYMGETYEEFYARVELMSEEDQEKMIREGVIFVPLAKDEIEPLVSFCADKNGIPYRSENINNLGPADFYEITVSVCVAISKIKINFVTKSEKKK